MVVQLGLAACAPPAVHHSDAAVKDGEGFRSIDPHGLYQKTQGATQVAIYDTNRPETWRMGHVPGAVHLRLADLDAAHLPADKGAMTVFYCSNEY